jgi:chlorobactene glucosyltransferase
VPYNSSGYYRTTLPTEPILVAATVASLWFLLITIANIRHLRWTGRAPLVKYGPPVSVVVPARNEGSNIGLCLDALLSQSYSDFEIIVIDDNSADETPSIVAGYAERDSRVVPVEGRPVPARWNGKQYACHQGVQRARGELLLFTDADVRHHPDSIARAVGPLRQSRAEFLSGYISQELGSIGELLIVPMTYIMTTLLLPLRFFKTGLFPSWGFAIGQYMLSTREALEAVGGYPAIKNSVVEDMALSRAMRRAGRRTAFVDARYSATCRMYWGYADAFRGFSKSVFGAVGGRALVIFGLTVAIFVLILLPFWQWCGDIADGGLRYYPSALPVLLFLGMWSAALRDRGLPPYLGLVYPLAFANLLFLGLVSTLRTGFGGGVEWKGRLARVESGDLPDPDILNAVVVVYNKLVFGLKVYGREHLREIHGGFFLISNHSLYLDPAVIAHSVFPRRVYFSAMAATFERPILGEFIRLLGAFPLPRESCLRRIMPAIEWALRRGR